MYAVSAIFFFSFFLTYIPPHTHPYPSHHTNSKKTLYHTRTGVETEVEVEEEVVMVELDVTTEEADAGGRVDLSSQRHEAPAGGAAARSSAAAATTTARRDMPEKEARLVIHLCLHSPGAVIRSLDLYSRHSITLLMLLIINNGVLLYVCCIW